MYDKGDKRAPEKGKCHLVIWKVAILFEIDIQCDIHFSSIVCKDVLFVTLLFEMCSLEMRFRSCV